jgi:uncharacterized protein
VFRPLASPTRATLSLSAMLLATLSGVASAAPSFDCRSATRAAEKTICGTPSIHPIDRAVSDLYRDTLAQARKVSDARAVDIIIHRAERTFIASRNTCGTDVDCIRVTYRGQFSILRTYLQQLD